MNDSPVSRTAKRFAALLKPYSGFCALLFFVILIAELVSITEKFIFKAIIDKGTEYSAGVIGKPEFVGALVVIAIVFASVALTRVVCKYFWHILITRIEADVITDLKRRFFSHIAHLSHRFHTTHKSGSLIARLSRGSRAVEKMMDTLFFYLVSATVLFTGSVIAMFTVDVASSLVLLTTIIAFLSYSALMMRVRYPYTIALNNNDDHEKGAVGDIFANIESVKYYGKEDMVNSKYKDLSEITRKAMYKSWGFYKWIDSVQHVILGLGTFFLIYIPIRSFLEGNATLGTIAFIYVTYMGVIGFMFRAVQAMREYYQASADLDSLYQYEDEVNEIEDAPGAKPLTVSKGAISFEKISFGYNSRTLFKDFSLSIKPGEKIALVGTSGAGKSSLIKLLYRFYNPQSGTIRIDNVDINKVQQESLRSELSIVPQECVLFDDTIENNIAFSKKGSTKEEIKEAMRFSQLDRLVKNLPHKEQTIVGERGIKLSGGEKQRVSIARAILANKKILILDEATSSLDSETEHEIQQDLKALMKNRTSIIIAHRLSTVMAADRIIVIEDGKIVQQGKHKELIKKKGRYQAFWELQKGGYI